MLRLSCTSARCWYGVWGRAQQGVGSPVVVVQGQGVLCFQQSCVCRSLGWGGSFPGFPRGMGCVGAEFIPVIVVVANEVGDLTEGLVHDNVLDGHGLVWRGGGVCV
jgi:hypothetical protein